MIKGKITEKLGITETNLNLTRYLYYKSLTFILTIFFHQIEAV